MIRWSDQIGELAKAIAHVQREAASHAIEKTQRATVPGPKGTREYAWADMPTLLRAVGTLMAEAGLARVGGVHVEQLPVQPDAGDQPMTCAITITLRIVHAASGQWVESEWSTTAPDAAPWTLGSAQTYGLRYLTVALMGLGVGGDDDDGATVQGPRRTAAAPKTTDKPANVGPAPKRIGKAFMERATEELARRGKTMDDLRAAVIRAGFGDAIGGGEIPPEDWPGTLSVRIRQWIESQPPTAE